MGANQSLASVRLHLFVGRLGYELIDLLPCCLMQALKTQRASFTFTLQQVAAASISYFIAAETNNFYLLLCCALFTADPPDLRDENAPMWQQ